ncbi:MAG: NAD-dependent epimerase/dehydratase family protein [Asticcacaulis sp.]
MSRVLVTGATGGLGLAVVEALREAGHDVRATGRRTDVAGRLEGVGAEFVAADLTADAMNGLVQDMDGVIHCAALSSPWGPYETFHKINVMATRHLLAAARQAGVRRFVFVSSPSIYARHADLVGLTEADPPAAKQLNAYAATKLLAEREVLAASSPAMACIAVRPRAIVGPDDTVLLPRVLRMIDGGRFPLIREGRALIELTDARDAAVALVRALDRARNGGGRGLQYLRRRPMTIRAMAETLAAALGREVRFVHLPYGVVSVAAVLSQAVYNLLPGRPEPRLTPYTLATLGFSQTFDLTRAREKLGYVPRHDAFQTAPRGRPP